MDELRRHEPRTIESAGDQVSPVITYSSGLPFTLGYSDYTKQVPSDAPNRVNGDTHAFHSQITGSPGNNLTFYNPVNIDAGGIFTRPGLDQIGNVGRNTVFGPRFFNGDISVQKNFTIREKTTLQLRADGFNAFNHINFGTPNGNIDQGGQITNGAYPNGASNPRQLQFSGRVQF